MKKIWRRTVFFYTDFDPEDFDVEDLAREVMAGNGYYVYSDMEVDDPTEEENLNESEFLHQCFEQRQDVDD